MDQYLRDIIQLSLGSTPERMLEKVLQVCIEISGAQSGSILGEEGPSLHFLFSNTEELIGMRVPFDSIAGTTVRKGVVIYTYAPKDARHFEGIDQQIKKKTNYLLSIPIPSIHQSAVEAKQRRNAGALQLLFDHNVFPDLSVEDAAQEFPVDAFRENELYEAMLKEIFWLLPNVAFGMEVLKLRHTSYQAIHELKNKLIAALSWLDYLKEDLQEQSPGILEHEAISQDVELADSSLREGAALAKTYLTFTQIYEPQYANGNVNDVLKEVAASAYAFARELKAPDLEVNEDLDASVPTRELDAAKLKMAFFNLCKNGIEALVENEVAKPIMTISSRYENGVTIITVADNGPGMPEDIASNLFIPFKTKKEGGTGLGLTITKKIIDIHDGRIRCETGSNGTTFTVSL
jgi:signal transduction histidine kinase